MTVAPLPLLLMAAAVPGEVGSPPTALRPVATAVSVARMGWGSVGDGTHFWFPQSSLTFDGGATIAVNVQLADDSQGCVPPACTGCYKVLPCRDPAERDRVLLSRDGGRTFSVADGANGTAALASFSITYGSAALNPAEALSTGRMTPFRPALSHPGSLGEGADNTGPTDGTGGTGGTLAPRLQIFGAVGHKLFLGADGSFANATASHHVVIDGIPPQLNVTGLLRWCDIATIAGGLYGEVVQLELGGGAPAGGTAHRELVFATSNDNFTFSYAGTIARSTDPVFAGTSNGPCESAVAALPLGASAAGSLRRAGLAPGAPEDGQPLQLLLAVFRVDSFAPYFHSVSLDGGWTWSAPQPCPTGVGSVRPRLRTIPGGGATVMLIGGRPGLRLWFGRVQSVTLDGGDAAAPADLRATGPAPAAAAASAHGPSLRGATDLGGGVALQWRWSLGLNLAAAHNALVPAAADRFPAATVNATGRSLHAQGTTGYTSVVATPAPTVGPGLAPASRFVVVYDRLGNGWDGPQPGGREDAVFAMQVDVA